MKSILIVDDDIIMNNSVKAMLADKYRVFQLGRGEQVMDFLRLKAVDLVLLDVLMQGMSGLEIAAAIRQNPETRQLPVIFLTGDTSDRTRRECMKAGGTDFITKPVGRDALIDAVEYQLMAAQAKERVQKLFFDPEGGSGTPGSVYRDKLTGLLGRGALAQKCRELMDDPERSCALIFMDIDNFKSINDIFGSAQGDALLKRLGTILAKLEEKGSIAGRLAGDKFMLLLPGKVTAAYVQELSDDIFTQLSKQPLKGYEPGAATFSMGVAFWPEDGENAERVAAMADMALQRGKALGKNRVYFAKNLAGPKGGGESLLPLDKLLRGRSSDKGAMLLQFGQLRILYRTLLLFPVEISARVRTVMLTVSPEDYDAFKAAALERRLIEKLWGIKALARQGENRLIALCFDATEERLRDDCEKILSGGDFGRVSVDVL